ncbi:FeoB-associated Cys-rich membrane protein [Bacillota bacterium Meth-B3]
MGTWVVGAIVAVVIGLAARKVYKDRKTAKGCGGGCGGGCAGCPHAGDSFQPPKISRPPARDGPTP